MKKNFCLLLISILFSINILAQTATPPAQGDGSAENPYEIANLENLLWIRENASLWDTGKYFIQTENIDASATNDWGNNGWNPIGTNDIRFNGNYDGQGYVISELFLFRSNIDNMGLFGYTENAIIRNLGLTDVHIIGRNYVGGLAGRLITTTLENCFTTGVVKGGSYVGGITGSIGGSDNVSDSYSFCYVDGTQHVGGFVGTASQSTLQRCFSNGNVWGNSNVGGFVGNHAANNSISNCYSLSRVIRKSGTNNNIGSFAGYNVASITNSFATGRVTYIGTANPNDKGFIGVNSGTGSLLRNYFDTETSFQTSGIGATGRTTAQMQQSSTFSGWNFTSTWGVVFGDYPFLNSHSFDPVEPEGEGSEEFPYEIESLSNLYWLSLNSDAWDKKFLQTQNINAAVTASWFDYRGFIPIGHNSVRFNGHYNARGHIIDSLFINRPAETNIGLFGFTNGATIEELGVINTNITGYWNVGAIVGHHGISGSLTSLIRYCFTSGIISGLNYIGGFTGQNRNAEINNSYSFSHVRRMNLASENSGAFTGLNRDSDIIHSYSIGSVFYSGANNPTDKGFVGAEMGTNSYTVNFFDAEASNQNSSVGATGRTTSQMKDSQTFSTWNFGTWIIDPGENDGYPYLEPHRALVETLPVIHVTSSSAVSGGEVTDDQGIEVTQRGIVWSSATNPTIDIHEGITQQGGGTGEFESQIIDLQPGSMYFVRAYAVNTVGVSYGDQLSFITLPYGSGTEEDPFQIANLTQLTWLADAENYWDRHFIQIDDIDASPTQLMHEGLGWKPIGNSPNTTTGDIPFSGSYNGQNYTISNLYINNTTTANRGLFGYLSEAKISDLTLGNFSITGSTRVATLAGSAFNSEIINVTVIETTVTGTSQTAGLIGLNSASLISHCTISGNIFGAGTTGGVVATNMNESIIQNTHTTCQVAGTVNVGGIAGLNTQNSLIAASSSTDGVVKGNGKVGGLTGVNNNSTIDNSFRKGSVVGAMTKNDSELGGITGSNISNSTISNSYSADGSISRAGYLHNHYRISEAGGVAGLNHNSLITNCYSTFNVIDNNINAGGLVGYNQVGVITRSHATGLVKGTSSLGGLVGRNSESGLIMDCYSRGNIVIATAWAYSATSQGGLIGLNSEGSVYHSYSTGVVTYEESGMPSPSNRGFIGTNIDGIYSGNYFLLGSFQTSGTGATGLTTDELKQQESFPGWDFLHIWVFEEEINNNYPILSIQKVPIVVTFEAANTTSNSTVLSGSAKKGTGADILLRGFVWDISTYPTLENADGIFTEAEGEGHFSIIAENLLPGTTYFGRSWAENETGISYGNQIEFITEVGPVAVTTKEVNEITETTALSGGFILSDGGLVITQKGIVWSTSGNPDLENNTGYTTEGEGNDDFTSHMTGLIPGTTYYVRAYATNDSLTSFGEEKMFVTLLSTPTFALSLSTNPMEAGLASLANNQPEGPFTEGTVVSITVQVNEGFEFIEWKDGDISIGTSPSMSFTMPGNDVELMAILSPITSNSVQERKSFTLYPNPFKDRIHLSSYEDIDRVMIYNITGKLVWSSSSVLNAIPATSLNQGIYLVSLTFTNGTTMVIRMVKN